MKLKLVIAVLLGAFAAARTARAELSIQETPAECRVFSWLPADARDETLAWNQLLSLARCLQRGPIAPIRDSEQLRAMVDREMRALEIPMMIYAAALDDGPGPVQVRAAYQLGMMHVALIVRARTAIETTERATELREELDSLLARSYRLAWLTFVVIDRAVERDPTLAPDPVTQNMVRSARAMSRLLHESAGAADSLAPNAIDARIPPLAQPAAGASLAP